MQSRHISIVLTAILFIFSFLRFPLSNKFFKKYSKNTTQRIISKSKINNTLTFPNLIGIGSKKCGTSAFQYYMSLHPEFVGMKKEVHFFDSWADELNTRMMRNRSIAIGIEDDTYQRHLNQYKFRFSRLFSKSSQNHPKILFEKTPRYFVVENVPELIKMAAQKNGTEESNLKFVLILCDPLKRAISDFKHCQKSSFFKEIIKEKYDNDFDKFLDYGFRYFDTNKIQNVENNNIISESSIRKIYTSKTPEFSILSNGFYNLHLKAWLKIFPDMNKFLIINGEEILKNLPKVILKVQKDLNLRKFFVEEKFYKNDKHFYCYDGNCLSEDKKGVKGRTRGEVVDFAGKSGQSTTSRQTTNLDRLKKFYAIWNKELYNTIGIDF